MAITFQDYTATASQTDFAFFFPFLEDEHVTVEIDAVVQPTSAYSIVTSPTKKIVLNSGATAGQIVRVQRVSQPDENLVDFVNGSVLTESELDRAYLHNRYLAEESAEQNSVSLRLQAGVNGWNAQNKKLLNLANPAANQDAATKDYVDTQDALKVAKAGDTMSGALDMGTNKITNLDTPTSSSDAATKNYIDTKIIDTAQLQDGAVTTAKLDADSVTNAKIADDSIDSEHYVDGSIDTAHIADNQITAAKISDTDHFFNVQSDGKVGIAATNPQARLHVSDDALLPNDTIFYQDNLLQSGTTGGGLKITSHDSGWRFKLQ